VTYLLVAFLVVAFTPLLVATWRTSLLGLGLQGLLMTAIVLQRGWPHDAGGAVLLVDVLVLRTWFVPRHLYGILRSQAAPRRSDVIPANLLSWTLAFALVVLAFRFASVLEPTGGDPALHVAVSAAALLLGLLVLGTQNTTFSQTIGALRLENAIALFELAGGHALPLPVQLGVSAVLVLTVLTFGRFLGTAGAATFTRGLGRPLSAKRSSAGPHPASAAAPAAEGDLP
jgi:hydrogenase-4 component E